MLLAPTAPSPQCIVVASLRLAASCFDEAQQLAAPPRSWAARCHGPGLVLSDGLRGFSDDDGAVAPVSLEVVAAPH